MDTTPTNDPIAACTLDPPGRVDRLAAWQALVSDALVDSNGADDRYEARFRGDPAIAARLDQLVALERSCCSFLSFDVTRNDAAITLVISGSGAGDVGPLLVPGGAPRQP